MSPRRITRAQAARIKAEATEERVEEASSQRKRKRTGALDLLAVKLASQASPPPVSARKRPRTAVGVKEEEKSDEEPPTLSKTAAKKLEAQKARDNKIKWKKAWNKWCEDHKWDRTMNPNYKQLVGNREMHKSEAMKYYRLSAREMGTIPYIEFENQYNLAQPGRSYVIKNIESVVYRKAAILAGVHEQIKQEAVMLEQGKILFDARTKDLEKKKSRKQPQTLTILPPKPEREYVDQFDYYMDLDADPRYCRPRGSWITRAYDDDGTYIGEKLNLKYEFFHAGEEYPYADLITFRPKGATWNWC